MSELIEYIQKKTLGATRGSFFILPTNGLLDKITSHRKTGAVGG